MLVFPLPSPSYYYLSDATQPILLEGGTFFGPFTCCCNHLPVFFCFLTLHFLTLRALVPAGTELWVLGLSYSLESGAKEPGVSSLVSCTWLAWSWLGTPLPSGPCILPEPLGPLHPPSPSWAFVMGSPILTLVPVCAVSPHTPKQLLDTNWASTVQLSFYIVYSETASGPTD